VDKVSKEGAAQAQKEIKAVEAWLGALAKKLGDDYGAILLSDAKGAVFADDQGGKNRGMTLGERDYFKVVQQGRANVSPLVESKISGKPVVVSASVLAGGRFTGAISAEASAATEEFSVQAEEIKGIAGTLMAVVRGGRIWKAAAGSCCRHKGVRPPRRGFWAK